MSQETVRIADHFYTIQGEGPTIGTPAYFLRSQGCNLQCGQPDWDRVEDKDDFESVKAQQSADATWTCDTMTTGGGGWMSGTALSYEDIESAMREEQEDIFDKLYFGEAHIVITGGEPLMQQEKLAGFLDYIDAENIYVEVETNATIKPTEGFDQYIDQYNTSPKLSNSGNPKEIRYKPKVIKWHRDSGKSYFKFVTATEDDTEEILTEWVDAFDLPADRVLLMPAGASQEALRERAQTVAELAKEHGFRYSPRAHIDIWNQMVSV